MEENQKYITLTKVQSELKAPKGQFNKFGNYKYRSCEDILEAVKPLLSKHGASITVSDEIVSIGDRIYVKATAKFVCLGGQIDVSAFAREEEQQKGMASAQITGSTSSYARKYALNGLLLIDDTQDDDASNKHGKDEQDKKPEPKKPTPKAEQPKLDAKPKLTVDERKGKMLVILESEPTNGILRCILEKYVVENFGTDASESKNADLLENLDNTDIDSIMLLYRKELTARSKAKNGAE